MTDSGAWSKWMTGEDAKKFISQLDDCEAVGLIITNNLMDELIMSGRIDLGAV